MVTRAGSSGPVYPRLAQHPVYAGVGFKSLADSWADTTTPHGRLLVTMLAGIAEFERELIRARTGEGRTRAKARGVRFGRPFPSISAKKLPSGLWRALRRLIWREPMV